MNTRALTSAAGSACRPHAGTADGQSAFACVYPGYAYAYFYRLAAGGV